MNLRKLCGAFALALWASWAGAAYATPTGACGAHYIAPGASSYTAGAGDDGTLVSPANATGPLAGWASASLPVSLPAPATAGVGWTMCGTSEGNKAVVFNVPLLAAPAAPTLGTSNGGSLGARTEYYKITYINLAGETVGSTEASVAVGANQLAVVSSPGAVGNAVSYNVYAASSSGAETKQNASPIALGTNWTEPLGGMISGAVVPSTGTATSAYILAGDQSLATLTVGPGNYQVAVLMSDGANYRVLSSYQATLSAAGAGTMFPTRWQFLPGPGYQATQGDNGNVLSAALASNLAVTLPPISAIRSGWTIGLAADGVPLTVQVNGTNGGKIQLDNGQQLSSTSLTTYAMGVLQFDGAVFRLITGAPTPTIDALAYIAAGTTDTAFHNACAAAATAGKTLIVDTAFTLAQSYTCAAPSLQFVSGGKLLTTAAAPTINLPPILAYGGQIFDTSAGGLIVPMSMPGGNFFSSAWGSSATGTGTVNRQAIQAMRDAAYTANAPALVDGGLIPVSGSLYTYPGANGGGGKFTTLSGSRIQQVATTGVGTVVIVDAIGHTYLTASASMVNLDDISIDQNWQPGDAIVDDGAHSLSIARAHITHVHSTGTWTFIDAAGAQTLPNAGIAIKGSSTVDNPSQIAIRDSEIGNAELITGTTCSAFSGVGIWLGTGETTPANNTHNVPALVDIRNNRMWCNTIANQDDYGNNVHYHANDTSFSGTYGYQIGTGQGLRTVNNVLIDGFEYIEAIGNSAIHLTADAKNVTIGAFASSSGTPIIVQDDGATNVDYVGYPPLGMRQSFLPLCGPEASYYNVSTSLGAVTAILPPAGGSGRHCRFVDAAGTWSPSTPFNLQVFGGWTPGTLYSQGASFTAQFTNYRMRIATPIVVGTGYAPADIIRLTCDKVGFPNATIQVDSVDGNGGILTQHVSSLGDFAAAPTTCSQSSSTGVGVGATFGSLVTEALAGPLMTVSSVATGAIGAFQPVGGAAAGTFTEFQISGTPGGAGIYLTTQAQTLASTGLSSGQSYVTGQGGKAYKLISSGTCTSASTGQGPSSTVTAFADGTCTWDSLILAQWGANQAASPGATFTGSISGTKLTVSGVTGTLLPNQLLKGSGITSGTYIVSGPATDGSYQVSVSQTVGSEAMSTGPSTVYDDAGAVYVALSAGTTASTGHGPYGLAQGQMDGTVSWQYATSGHSIGGLPTRSRMMAWDNLDLIFNLSGGRQWALASGRVDALPGTLVANTQTSSFTITGPPKGQMFPLDSTSVAFTVTMPLNPNSGDEVITKDVGGAASTHNITFNWNGKKYQGSTSNLVESTNYFSHHFQYYNNTVGWIEVP